MNLIKSNKCFWCDKNLPKIINNYKPCSNCNLLIKNGIFLIEVQPFPMQLDQPSFITPFTYPTGKWESVNSTFLVKFFREDFIKEVSKQSFVFLTRENFENLGLRIREKVGTIH